MPSTETVLWLNLSRGLRCLHRPLLRELSRYHSVAQWDYQQGLDEPASLDEPLTLLHDHLKSKSTPTHLAGHGLSGVLGLLYARQYPERVKSLTLLAVGPQPDILWQSHYYTHRRLLGCNRDLVFSMLVSQLFGESVRSIAQELACRLKYDLDETPSPHSLLQDGEISAGGAPVPIFACGSADDVVVGSDTLERWRQWLSPDQQDAVWQCPSGKHFFHYFHANQVCRAMVNFWRSLEVSSPSASWSEMPEVARFSVES